MPQFTDQLGRNIDISINPQRIISLVPSQTELLYDLGLDQEVVGITKFCIHPQNWYHTKARVGGTKQLDIERIKDLQPDLIIANKEENTKEQIEELCRYFPVWISDIANLSNAMEMIYSIGQIVSKEKVAASLVLTIESKFQSLMTHDTRLSAAYLIWRNPYMTVGGDTFINDMLRLAGFENIFKEHLRYPGITIQQLKESNCQTILLSSEPYPFKEKHITELQHHLPNTKIILVDGEMFSWYGSRLQYAPDYFKALWLQINR